MLNTNSAVIAAWSATTPINVAFDCNGGDFLIVGVFTNASSVTVSYNGVALTQLAYFSDAASNKQGFYYLPNPASGSNNITVTRTGGAAVSVVASAYSGVDTSNPIDNYVTNAGILTNVSSFSSSNVTVSNADNWLISTFRDVDLRVVSSTNVSLRVVTGVVPEACYDSNGAVGTTGSINASYTLSPAGRLHGHILVAVNAAAAGGGGPTFTPKVMWFS